MFNLFNKIPKGYVETVDGYLIKESEAKKVVIADWYGIEESKTEWHRKENAPKYDLIKRGLVIAEFYITQVEVKEDGTPKGYHTQEEVQKLKDRIKELEDKYEPKSITVNGNCGADFIFIDEGEFSKPKNKRGRPKKK